MHDWNGGQNLPNMASFASPTKNGSKILKKLGMIGDNGKAITWSVQICKYGI